MSEDNKYDIKDMISAAVLQKPIEFETAFSDIMIDRIRNAVEAKKIEVAQQLYNYQPDIEVENDDEFGGSDAELDNSETPEEEEHGEAA